jgi:hypothetical protein
VVSVVPPPGHLSPNKYPDAILIDLFCLLNVYRPIYKLILTADYKKEHRTYFSRMLTNFLYFHVTEYDYRRDLDLSLGLLNS